jgi:hypothetical protein
MRDRERITGDEEFDSDLHEFLALVEDDQRLAAAKRAVANESLSLQELSSSLPRTAIRVILDLLDADDFSTIAPHVKEEKGRRTLQRAFELAKEHFGRLYGHRAVVREMRRQMASGAEDSLEGRISGVGWTANWQDVGGKLAPAGLLRLQDRADKVVLTSPLDWDDLAFLIAALCRHFAAHMEKSKSILDAGLLIIPDAERIAQRIQQASQDMRRIEELGGLLGLAVQQTDSQDE